MKKEINLEEILESIQLENGAIIRSYISKEGNIYKIIREAMKEACERCLDLAAENATTTRISYFDGTESQQLNGIDIWEEDSSVPCYLAIIDKDSILQIKDWIK